MGTQVSGKGGEATARFWKWGCLGLPAHVPGCCDFHQARRGEGDHFGCTTKRPARAAAERAGTTEPAVWPLGAQGKATAARP